MITVRSAARRLQALVGDIKIQSACRTFFSRCRRCSGSGVLVATQAAGRCSAAPDTSGIAQLNRAQLERVLSRTPLLRSAMTLEGRTPAVRARAAAPAAKSASGHGRWAEQRLLAVREAALWGNRSVLPLLRQALRDSDSAVVELPRKRSAPPGSTQPAVRQSARPPRNVARMR